MKRATLILLSGLLAAAGLSAQPAPPPATAATSPSPVSVRLQTELGDIVVELETRRAPVTAANFLRYVDQRRYDGVGFYRAMNVGDSGELGLVQAGWRGDPQKILKPIKHESTNDTGLSHTDGAISMARAAPGTASSDFFIVQGSLTGLDANIDDPGYAVFGHVTEGMEVVRAILQRPRSPTATSAAMIGQMLVQPVKIIRARRVPPEAAPGATPAPAPTAVTPAP